MYQSKAAIDTQFGAHRCRETGRRYSLHLQKNDVGVYDGDLVLVLNSPLMMKGVDKNAKIVIDIEDKVTALAEKDTIQNRTACIMRSLKSLNLLSTKSKMSLRPGLRSIHQTLLTMSFL